MQRLAEGGLTYTQWHTTSLCSPTRSCFLTGRNHHQTGFACIVEGATGYPGSNAHLPRETATLAHVLRGSGYNTYWVGKDHNVPPEEDNPSGPKFNWPLQQGFDRFYGFLGGETNQWYPTLTEDNHAIEQPYPPEEGYHLSKDLADQALRMLRDGHSAAPSRPWFMWFCPGANHAPHHVDPAWADKYKGQFDDGYEAYREWVLQRMIDKGVMPEGTGLTPLNPMPEGTFSPADTVRPWDSLSSDEKRLFARMAEVFAGFSEYTDHQVGRIVDFLEQTGQLDNTLILYCADNGASGEGGPDGSVNENKFFNGWPDDIEENLRLLDDLGRPEHLQPLPDGLGGGVLDPVQDVQALLVRGRHVRPAGDPLAEGLLGARRAAPPVPPRHRRLPDDPRLLRGRDARRLRRRRAGPARRHLDALHVRRRRPDHPRRPVLRDARHARDVGGRLEGRRRARPDLGHRPLRRRPVGALQRRRGPLGGPRPRGRAPGAH